ncbi:MAG: peptidoglycan-binding protein, partial [Planctomycetota bacterium]
LNTSGVWKPVGRYDVGFYARERLGQPHLRANATGGVDFGFGYDQSELIDTTKAGKFVWMTGDALCDPDGPCTDPATGKHNDVSEVYGLQGLPASAYVEVAPKSALKPYPASGTPYPAKGPDKAYMIDADINVDASGKIIAAELARNDATKVGDVEVFAPVAPPVVAVPPAYPPPGTPTYPPGVAPPGYPPGVPPLAPVVTDLALSKTVLGDCKAGQPCRFRISVTNNGAYSYSGLVIVKDTMPKGWKFGSAKGPWACQQKGNLFSCGLGQKTLASKKSLTLDVALKAAALPVGKPVENCAEIDWKGGGDAYPTNDKACATVTLKDSKPKQKSKPTPEFDLTIEKSGDQPSCSPDKDCPYTLKITNAKESKVTFKGTLLVLDWFSAGASSYRTPAGSKWRCDESAWSSRGRLCQRPGTVLAPGKAVELKIIVKWPSTQLPTLQNCGEILWPAKIFKEQKSIHMNRLVRYVQAKLASLKFYTGKITGKVDSATRKAIENFRKNNNIAGKGEIDAALLKALGMGATGDTKELNDKDCITTPVVKSTSPAPGPEGPLPPGSGKLVKPEYDLMITKESPGTCYWETEACEYTITIKNIGDKKFQHPIGILDETKTGWTFRYIKHSPDGSGWTCFNASTGKSKGATGEYPNYLGVYCSNPLLTLEPNKSVVLKLSTRLKPSVGTNPKKIENCVNIVFPAFPYKDKEKNNNRACATVNLDSLKVTGRNSFSM